MKSNPKGFYGIHSVCLYDRANGLPITLMQVLGDFGINFGGEMQDLMGGAQMFPFDSEISSLKSDVSLTAREYSAEAMQQFLGATILKRAAEAGGNADGFANIKGTSVVKETTGIASISVITSTGAANLKTGRVVIVAASASTIDVYLFTDIDNKRGTVTVDFVDDTCKINATPISISGATTNIPELGIQLTKGSGTLALTIGDSAEFWIRKPNILSYDAEFGSAGTQFGEFGLIAYGQKSSDGSINMIQLYRCKAAGMPVNFKEKGWSEWSGTIKPLYDSAKGAVGRISRIQVAA